MNIISLKTDQIIFTLLILVYSIFVARLLTPFNSWVKLTTLSYREATQILENEINENVLIEQKNLQIREGIYKNIKQEVEAKSFFLTGGISFIIQHAAHVFLPGLGFLFHGLSREITEDIIGTKFNTVYNQKKIPTYTNARMNSKLRALYTEMRALKIVLYIVTVSYFMVAFLIHYLSVIY